jgi:hypothetical protein
VINYSTITTALAAQIYADATIQKKLRENYIERGGIINEVASRAPWIGVYRSSIKHTPRTLGLGAQNWESQGAIRICIQHVDMKSGSACEDSLESLVQLVVAAIINDSTIGGTVDFVKDYSVDYRYLESDRKSLYFQMAILTITFEVRTS